MSEPYIPYEALGFAQISAALLSFMSSLRIFGVIVSSRDLRSMSSYQLIAYIAFIECCQAFATSMCGIMVAKQNTFNELLLHATGNLALITWITLIVLRFSLAFNRFTVITSFSRLLFLKSHYVHWLILLVPTCVLIAMITVFLICEVPFFLTVELAGWDYKRYHFIADIEKLSSNIFSLASFILYTKHQANIETNLNDVKLLISSGLTFIYEMVIIVLFDWVLPYVTISALWNGIVSTMWAAMPAFNGLMLLTVNKSFRRRFFAAQFLKSLQRNYVSTVASTL